MKSIIRSVKPYWVWLILMGKKTVEVGKDFPKSEDWNKVVEIYCSKDMRSFNRIPGKDREWMRKYLGKVACRFVCDRIEKFVVGSLACDDVEEKTCLSYKEICDYFYGDNYDNTVRVGYAWHISDLKIYDKPKWLGEFRRNGEYCDDCKYLEEYIQVCKMYGAYLVQNELLNWTYRCDKCLEENCEITRPPQPWYYVEEL